MARMPIHPGEILADELEEIGLSAKKLADVIEVPPNRLYQLLAGRRNVTADTALRLVSRNIVTDRPKTAFASSKRCGCSRTP
jgi:addiction module HigA family antidote